MTIPMQELRTIDNKWIKVEVRDEDRLTLWTNPDELMHTGYGKITYREWCERERDRINKTGGSTKIVMNQDGQIALFR